MLLYLQSPAQFDAIYDKATTEAILSNCATQLYFYSQSLANAKYISERCHKVSVDTQAQSKRRGLLMRPTTTVSTTPKEVITVDELLTLGGAGRQLAVAFISGKPPVLVQRVNHYTVPEMRVRLGLSAPDLKRLEVLPAAIQPIPEVERQVDVAHTLHAATPPLLVKPSKPKPVKPEVN